MKKNTKGDIIIYNSKDDYDELMFWIVPRLIADGNLVSMMYNLNSFFSYKSQPASRRIILLDNFINPKLSLEIKENKLIRENDLVLISPEKEKMIGSILKFVDDLECKIMLDTSKLNEEDSMKLCTEKVFYPINMRDIV